MLGATLAIGGNALQLFGQQIQRRYHVILPSCRVHPKLAPALLVYTIVYTIVIDDHENNWQIVPEKNKNVFFIYLLGGFNLLEYLFKCSSLVAQLSSGCICKEKFGTCETA